MCVPLKVSLGGVGSTFVTIRITTRIRYRVILLLRCWVH